MHLRMRFCGLTFLRILVGLSLTHFSQARAENSWKAHYPEARSEAWTWMGHLWELDNFKLSDRGWGLIHYFTRNQSDFGSLVFSSSALTPTHKGKGVSYDKRTRYTALRSNARLELHKDRLDLLFKWGRETDRVQEIPYDAEVDALYLNHLLGLYPGLKIAPAYEPRKYRFRVWAGQHTRLELTLYQIWPEIAPNGNGRIRFLGESDTYTYSQPMLVAYGHVTQPDGTSKSVSGLMFLDRQWGSQFFGNQIFSDLKKLLRFSRALDHSHSWSAFHVQHKKTQSWSFVHLWQQYLRSEREPDQLDPYSGLIWMKDGVSQGSLGMGEYRWEGDRFVKEEKSQILIPYAKGRTGFWPTRYILRSEKADFWGQLEASPKLQSLDQPIYLYEGYASGQGLWEGEEVSLMGRVESSRLLFRNQDYREMIENLEALKRLSPEESRLLARLHYHAESPMGYILYPFSWIARRFTNVAFWFSEIELKLAVFFRTISQETVGSNDSKTSDFVTYQ